MPLTLIDAHAFTESLNSHAWQAVTQLGARLCDSILDGSNHKLKKKKNLGQLEMPLGTLGGFVPSIFKND